MVDTMVGYSVDWMVDWMVELTAETMVVLMVAGGAAAIPISLFDPVRPMPASLAAEMGEAPFGSLHYHALFATGMVLLLLTLAFNLLADYISQKFKEVGTWDCLILGMVRLRKALFMSLSI